MQKQRLCFALFMLACALPAAHAGRALEPADWLRFKPVYDVHIAPDGATVAYLVNRYDKEADESIADLWSVSWTGKADTQLTHGETVSDPSFSPDGRYLSYLTAHPQGSTTQLWLRELRSGATRAVTHVKQEIESYAWSADGRQVALVMHEGIEEPEAKDEKKKPPKPIVVDAFQFKADKEGYLTAELAHTPLPAGHRQRRADRPARGSQAHRLAPGILAGRQVAGLRRPPAGNCCGGRPGPGLDRGHRAWGYAAALAHHRVTEPPAAGMESRRQAHQPARRRGAEVLCLHHRPARGRGCQDGQGAHAGGGP